MQPHATTPTAPDRVPRVLDRWTTAAGRSPRYGQGLRYQVRWRDDAAGGRWKVKGFARLGDARRFRGALTEASR